MSTKKRFVIKIESVKSELEATIEMKIDNIKADYVKTINYLDMKISAIK